MSLNRVILDGNLTRDPELKYVSNGVGVCDFSIASNRVYKNSAGETIKEVDYFDCQAWASGAEQINNRFKKGNGIIVEGSLRTDTWEDKNTGQKRSRCYIRVERFHFPLKGPEFQGSAKKNNDTEEVEAEVGSGESLPF